MRAKGGEVERVSRERVELLFGRLCPGRCELIEVKAQVSEPKPVGRVMPGFDAPTAGEVKVNALEVKVMIDSALPRSFRSNLPRMVQHRLSDLSTNVLVTPIQLEFPKPQLAPAPPMMPEARPKAPEPAPPPPQPEPQERPEPEPEPVKAPQEDPLTLLDALPYLIALALGLALFALWRQLNALKSTLTDQRSAQERDPAQRPPTSAQPEGQGGEGYPDLDAMRARLAHSRGASNDALRRWLSEDSAEVASLTRMLGASLLSDLKRDASLREPLERVSELVRAQRVPVPAERAWRVAHALEARLTSAELTAREGALKGAWAFLHGLTPAELYALHQPLSYAEQGHLLAQLPTHLRAALLDLLSVSERQGLVLYAHSEAPLTREASLSLAHRLQSEAQARSGLSEEASAHLELTLEMLTSMSFEAQASTLSALEQQRPELAQLALGELCLEGALYHLPLPVLTEALILTPFEEALTALRSAHPQLQALLTSALPAQRATLYLDELEVPVALDEEARLKAWASFLHRVKEATRRAQLDLAAINKQAISALA